MRWVSAVGFLGLAACEAVDSAAPVDSAPAVPGYPDTPVLVYVVLDTIGTTAARDTDLCGAVGALTGRHELDVACLDGAIAPSSWTGESHLRDLWPEYLEGSRRAEEQPDCAAESVFARIVAERGATYVVGVQNGVLGASLAETCGDGQNAWFQGASVVHRGTGGPDDTPLVDGVADLVAAAATGAPVVALLNTLEGGSHTPRCDDASTDACQALYALGVEYGIADTADVPAQAEFWADPQRYFRLFTEIERRHDQSRAAPIVAATIEEHLDARQAPYVIDRLEPLFEGLSAAGRLDDLTLVLVSDHGENPCYADPVTGNVNCAHTGAPSEWTANVPVLVVPAERAEAWTSAALVGDATTPWSTTALAWGFLDAAATAPPAAWPARPTPGVVTSWSCRAQSRHEQGPSRFGLRVSPSGSVRCTDGECGAWSWTNLPTIGEAPTALSAVPDELAGFIADPDWTTSACE